MRKTDLINAVAVENGLSFRKATEVVNSVFGTIASNLRAKNSVCVTGFGTFRTHTKHRCTVHVNAKTHQYGGKKRVVLPTMKVVAFTTGNGLRRVVRRKARKL